MKEILACPWAEPISRVTIACASLIGAMLFIFLIGKRSWLVQLSTISRRPDSNLRTRWINSETRRRWIKVRIWLQPVGKGPDPVAFRSVYMGWMIVSSFLLTFAIILLMSFVSARRDLRNLKIPIQLFFKQGEKPLFPSELVEANRNRQLRLLMQTKDLLIVYLPNRDKSTAYVIQRGNLEAAKIWGGDSKQSASRPVSASPKSASVPAPPGDGREPMRDAAKHKN